MVIDGGCRVDGGRFRQLEQQAERLGFANLRTCLQALSDAGYSLSRLAEELHATRWLVSQALSEFGIQRQDPRARLAQQRRLAAEERVARRVGELGFGDVQAYLVERGWLAAAVVAELGAAPVTARRLLDRCFESWAGTGPEPRTPPRASSCGNADPHDAVPPPGR